MPSTKPFIMAKYQGIVNTLQENSLDLDLLSKVCKVQRQENKYTCVEFYEFAKYVLSFYNSESQLYPFNCTDDVIIEFCQIVMIHSNKFEGDSLDREQVRKLLETFGYQEKE